MPASEQQASDSGAAALDPAVEHALLQRVLRLLERVESHSGAGVIGFGVGQLGRGQIVVSRQRICLVADAPRPYFGELLGQSDPELGILLMDARARAHAQGRRFSEVLLELGGATIARIRSFLRDQCALALVSMAETHLQDELEFYGPKARGRDPSPDAALRWASTLAPADADYDKRLTFSLIEVYEAAAKLMDCCPADRASEVFGEFASSSALALLLWRSPVGAGVSLPIACSGSLEQVTELRRLAYAADQLCLAPALRAAGVVPDVLMFGAHWNDIVCVYGQHRIALICLDDIGQKAQLANRCLGPA